MAVYPNGLQNTCSGPAFFEIDKKNKKTEQPKKQEEFFSSVKSNLLAYIVSSYFKQYVKENGNYQEECVICKESFGNEDIISEFLCNKHIFHRNCLTKWLDSNETCPICNFNLMSIFKNTL